MSENSADRGKILYLRRKRVPLEDEIYNDAVRWHQWHKSPHPSTPTTQEEEKLIETIKQRYENGPEKIKAQFQETLRELGELDQKDKHKIINFPKPKIWLLNYIFDSIRFNMKGPETSRAEMRLYRITLQNPQQVVVDALRWYLLGNQKKLLDFPIPLSTERIRERKQLKDKYRGTDKEKVFEQIIELAYNHDYNLRRKRARLARKANRPSIQKLRV